MGPGSPSGSPSPSRGAPSLPSSDLSPQPMPPPDPSLMPVWALDPLPQLYALSSACTSVVPDLLHAPPHCTSATRVGSTPRAAARLQLHGNEEPRQTDDFAVL